MIAAREASITVTALEGLGAGVLSVVASQLVAACKAPFASFPRTLVRLFTCNRGRRKEENFVNKKLPEPFHSDLLRPLDSMLRLRPSKIHPFMKQKNHFCRPTMVRVVYTSTAMAEGETRGSLPPPSFS